MLRAELTRREGFILRTLPYLERDLLVDLFTLEQGRVRALIKRKRGGDGMLVPFTRFSCELTKLHRDLADLCYVEPVGRTAFLQGNSLWMAYYLNELLLKLLPVGEKETEIYYDYLECLDKLAGNLVEHEVTLRVFEKRLLTHLGYGLNLQYDLGGEVLRGERYYRFIYSQGFAVHDSALGEMVFSGEVLLSLAEERVTGETLPMIKRLLKYVIYRLTGGKLLKSREFYRALVAS